MQRLPCKLPFLVVRLLLSNKNKQLLDINLQAAERDSQFSLLLSLPSFVLRACRCQKIATTVDFFLPEVFHVHLISTTYDQEVFPSVVRLILRRNRGRAIAHGLWVVRNHLETGVLAKLLQKGMTGREQAEFIRCVIEYEIQNPSSVGLSKTLCTPLFWTSLVECCHLLVLSTSLPQNNPANNALVYLFAELLKESLFPTQTVDLFDDSVDCKQELSKIVRDDRVLWLALIEVSSVWSSSVYVRQTDHACQALTTQFLLRALVLLRTQPIPMESIVPMNLLNGVNARLSATNQSIRLDGMRIGECLAKGLGDEVKFDELHVSEIESTSIPQQQGKDITLYDYPRENDDSSDGSVHLQTFDLFDDQEDLLEVQRPLYLSECLDYFRSSESDENGLLRVEVALKSVPELVRSAPADLRDFGPEIARSVLRLENKSNLSNFEELSAEALRSLVVMDPISVGTNLIEEVFQDCSLGDRLAALTALGDAAIELSGGHLNEQLPGKDSLDTFTYGYNDAVVRKCSRDHGILANIVPAWFYLIAKHFIGRAEDESLWSGEIGAHLLSHIISTLSRIVVSVGKFTPAIDLIAMDFFRLVWCFKDSETPDIRLSVTDAARAIIQVVPGGMKVKLLSDNSVGGLMQYLTRVLESDPDERCRSSAATTIIQISEERDIICER